MNWIITQGFSAGPACGVSEFPLRRDGHFGIFFADGILYLLLIRRGRICSIGYGAFLLATARFARRGSAACSFFLFEQVKHEGSVKEL